MKIGNLEGSPEEIKNFCENNNFNAKDLLDIKSHQVNIAWLILPSIFLFILTILLVIFDQRIKIFLCLLTIGLLLDIWLSVVIYLKYRNKFLTFFIIISIFLALLVASKILYPKELLEYLIKIKNSGT